MQHDLSLIPYEDAATLGIKPDGPIVHAANCRIEPLFPGAADREPGVP